MLLHRHLSGLWLSPPLPLPPPARPPVPCSCVLQNLVHALADIASALPDLLEDIQGQLLDLMALILSGEGGRGEALVFIGEGGGLGDVWGTGVLALMALILSGEGGRRRRGGGGSRESGAMFFVGSVTWVVHGQSHGRA